MSSPSNRPEVVNGPIGDGVDGGLRASAPAAELVSALGPLQELPGTWVGSGFNLIARPHWNKEYPNPEDFFLQLNATDEELVFEQIGAPIPDRGSLQGDIFFNGLNYLQRVSDSTTHAALHLEPGIWINVPQTTEPEVDPSVVRLATIPHGTSLLAQGGFRVMTGKPNIDRVDPKPLQDGKPFKGGTGYLDPYLHPKLPPGIPGGAVDNPNIVLTEAIKGQSILETVLLTIATTTASGGFAGGIENMPFLMRNAEAIQMKAVFWIEKVEQAGQQGSFMQLQYTQTVLLRFGGIDWPHISVATLVKQ